MCANSINQRKIINNEEADLPTIATESVSKTAEVSAHEGRYMTMFYFTGAYIYT